MLKSMSICTDPPGLSSNFKYPILTTGEWKIRYRPDVEGVKFSHCRDPNGSVNGRESNFVNTSEYTPTSCITHSG